MKLNDLLLSLVYLFGLLTLAAAQEDEPRRRLGWSLRKRGRKPLQPQVDMDNYMSAQQAYFEFLSTQIDQNEDAVLTNESVQNDLLKVPLSDQSEYAVVSSESVQNESLSAPAVLPSESVKKDESLSVQSVDPPNSDHVSDEPCPSGPDISYKGDSADMCARIRFFCDEEAGLGYFSAGHCGCGCSPIV
jgi:hypothetical protein